MELYIFLSVRNNTTKRSYTMSYRNILGRFGHRWFMEFDRKMVLHDYPESEYSVEVTFTDGKPDMFLKDCTGTVLSCSPAGAVTAMISSLNSRLFTARTLILLPFWKERASFFTKLKIQRAFL